MGIGDWGLGIGDWGLGPIPNPQSPIPNPHDAFKFIIYMNNNIFIIISKIYDGGGFCKYFLSRGGFDIIFENNC